jgi:hypothetical protein
LRSRSLVLLAFLVASPLAAASPQLEIVRKNFVDYYSAAGADRSSPRMVDALATLEAQARSFTAPDYLRADGTWSDIDYTDQPDGSWSPWDHFRRLTVMAKAYRTPGQALYRNPQLLASIEAALAQVPRFYGTTTLPLGNWWFWTLGAPLDLGPTLVLMRGDISQATYDDCVKTLAVHIGSGPYSRGLTGPVPVAENLVWSSYTHLCLALLKDDDAMLAAVRDAMASVAQPSMTADGIKPDASFWQHGPQLYTGGYGGSFANDVARYALLTRGTPYTLPPASLATFADYLADGVAWSLYGNYFDVSVVGREVARVSTTGFHGVAALAQAAMFDSPRAAEIRAAAARMLQSWQWSLPPELAGVAAIADRNAAAWPAGHRHYFLSDYSVQRREGWFASIKMFSTRTKSGERTNDENLLGARQSDGRFYLVMNGNEYFGRDVWPALDWTRLPGTTVEQKADTATAAFGFATRSVVGGTGDGRNGVSAMDLAPLGSSLTAKKSWFFFDDAIVFLTNSITSPSANRVETIVQQWPLMNEQSQLVRGSNWMTLEGAGYFFPAGGDLRTDRTTRTGTWAALGGSTDTTPHTATLVTIALDHGTTPSNETDAYIVVPNTTPAAMQQWAQTNPMTIVANDASISAVRDRRTNATGIVFWRAGAVVEGMESDAPAVAWMTDDGKTLRLSASDPTNGTGTFHLTLPGRFTSTDAKAVTGTRSTTIELPRNGGKTTTVTLQRVLVPARRRAV